MTGRDRVDLSAVIVTWNGWTLLEPMLQSLYSCAREERIAIQVVVVDNGSTDGTSDRVLRVYPDATAVALARNEGFAIANNRGVERTTGPLIALFNNDIVFEPGALTALVSAAKTHPEAGVFASQMVDFDDTSLVDNRGIVQTFAGNFRQRDAGARRPPERPAGPVYGASGGACLIRRSMLQKIGLFDESLGTYLEDADFAARCHTIGDTCWYVPEAVIRHVGSATASQLPDWKVHILARNQSALRIRWSERRLWHPGAWAAAAHTAWLALRAIRSGRFKVWMMARREGKTLTPRIAGYPGRISPST